MSASTATLTSKRPWCQGAPGADGARGQCNARGITDTRPDILELEWVTERIAIVEVRCPYLDAQGHEKGEETSTYTLRRNDAGELKLHVAVMHGASGT